MAEGIAPTPGVGILAEPSFHILHLTEVLSALDACGDLAGRLQGVVCDGTPLALPHGKVLPIMALDRLESLLVRAQALVKEQRAQASGWPAV